MDTPIPDPTLDDPGHRLLASKTGRDHLLPEAPWAEVSVDTPPGLVALSDDDALQRAALQMRQRLEHEGRPVGPLTAGQLGAYGLVNEALAIIVGRYRASVAPGSFEALDAHLRELLGDAEARPLLRAAAGDFPTPDLDAGALSPDDFLAQEANRTHILAVLLLLAAAERNPGFRPFLDLFAAPGVARTNVLQRAIDAAEAFFQSQPRIGPDDQTLLDVLLSPARHAEDLETQLDHLLTRYSDLLGDTFLRRALRARDRIHEELTWTAPVVDHMGHVHLPEFGPPPPADAPPEVAERFWAPPEQHWMPRAILVAKNTPVWLDQLTRSFGRPIRHLDQIPDEALKELVDRGFTALWLIGVWNRSPASQRIKHRMGNPDALASAYSLYDYGISDQLGGDEALARLRTRAKTLGLRLAADMVPNHTGIVSRWVSEHPDWFLQLDHPPYPSYRFTGPDLSDDPSVEIRLEDGYWNHSDAAVVFERRDPASGDVRYIYHGNDGTQMPWNDTAQLDFTREDVRQAVLETILSVADRFDLIRFDAAMTLTRYHYQRLWFPEPGHGGTIPSRSRFSLTTGEFHQRMPREFWRTVTETAAKRAPDTLLLAEAFWLTEGLFVRELGMHRVYNSAFMKMLSAERNGEYRKYLMEILVNDPAVLARLVNFMTNPDEETALALFGHGDKYLGVATLLVTLPGLPMFGHGQVEGLAEKYGMEFPRAYWDEQPDAEMVARHAGELWPLMTRRALFAGTSHFAMFDFEREDGGIDDNVFAYVNAHGGDRTLVVFNNRLDSTSGWLRRSVPTRTDARGLAGVRELSLAQALGISGSEGRLTFTDMRGREPLVLPASELGERGLRLDLRGYESRVLLLPSK